MNKRVAQSGGGSGKPTRDTDLELLMRRSMDRRPELSSSGGLFPILAIAFIETQILRSMNSSKKFVHHSKFGFAAQAPFQRFARNSSLREAGLSSLGLERFCQSFVQPDG